MEPKKVLFLDQGEFVGGAERFLIDFINALSKYDLSYVLCGASSQAYKDLLGKEVKTKNFVFPSVKGGVFRKFIAIFKLLQAAFKLRSVINNENFTHVYSNTPRTHFVMLFLKVLLGSRVKWVVMFHDFTTPGKLVRMIGKKATVLIANSLPTRSYLRNSVSEDDYGKIKIIENSINFNEIPAENIPFGVEKILSLGRIDPRKGQIYILEAADLLFERNPNLRFSVVGDPVLNDYFTQNYQTKLQEFKTNRNLTNVQFLPSVKDPFSVINKADLVVFSSVEPETFGRIVIESLVLGKMVLSFDITGPREILKSFVQYLNDAGVEVTEDFFLVELKNSMSLAEKLGYLNDNPDLVYNILEKAREFVFENYNLVETKKRLLLAFD